MKSIPRFLAVKTEKSTRKRTKKKEKNPKMHPVIRPMGEIHHKNASISSSFLFFWLRKWHPRQSVDKKEGANPIKPDRIHNYVASISSRRHNGHAIHFSEKRNPSTTITTIKIHCELKNQPDEKPDRTRSNPRELHQSWHNQSIRVSVKQESIDEHQHGKSKDPNPIQPDPTRSNTKWRTLQLFS